MKALSIRQPWAWAIVSGFKPVENRTWRTGYRGPILIHAGLREDYEDVDYCLSFVLGTHPKGSLDREALRQRYLSERGPLGHVVGQVDMVDCVTDHASAWFFGPFGFVLSGARTVDPIPLRGRLGIFNVDLPRIP